VTGAGLAPLSFDVDELLGSLSFDLRCEQQAGGPGELCGAEAAAAMACRFCPFAFFVCADHLSKWRAAAAKRSFVRCTKCGKTAPTLDELILITPVHS
jgi:hypothetical protein